MLVVALAAPQSRQGPQPHLLPAGAASSIGLPISPPSCCCCCCCHHPANVLPPPSPPAASRSHSHRHRLPGPHDHHSPGHTKGAAAERHWSRAARRAALSLWCSHAATRADERQLHSAAAEMRKRLVARELLVALVAAASAAAADALTFATVEQVWARRARARLSSAWPIWRAHCLVWCPQRLEMARVARGQHVRRELTRWRRSAVRNLAEMDREITRSDRVLRHRRREGLRKLRSACRRAAALDATPHPARVSSLRALLRWVRNTPSLLEGTAEAATAHMRLRALRKAREQWQGAARDAIRRDEAIREAKRAHASARLRRWRHRCARTYMLSVCQAAHRARLALRRFRRWRGLHERAHSLGLRAVSHVRRVAMHRWLVGARQRQYANESVRLAASRDDVHATRRALLRWRRDACGLWTLNELWRLLVKLHADDLFGEWREIAISGAASRAHRLGAARAVEFMRARRALRACRAGAAAVGSWRQVEAIATTVGAHLRRRDLKRVLRRLTALAAHVWSNRTHRHQMKVLGLAAFTCLSVARCLRTWRRFLSVRRVRAAGRRQVEAQMDALWADVRASVVRVYLERAEAKPRCPFTAEVPIHTAVSRPAAPPPPPTSRLVSARCMRSTPL